MKPIETTRLILRPVDPDRDAAFVLKMLNEPDYIANVADRGVGTVAKAADYIREKFLPNHERYGVGYCVAELKTSGTPVGSSGLMKRDTYEDFDIGYSTLMQFAGNGYAFEAASAMMHYGRSELGLKRIIGFTSPTNAKSVHLLEKLGLRYERMVQVPGFDTEGRLYAWEEDKEVRSKKSDWPRSALSTASLRPVATTRSTSELLRFLFVFLFGRADFDLA